MDTFPVPYWASSIAKVAYRSIFFAPTFLRKYVLGYKFKSIYASISSMAVE
ncbi:hypothetical protein BFJ63_vAg14168 [Fusarium oxysporum f. sp. narcissi]|uniref:Uncharacterized protein n=3 Tax=Fusarium oxysporum TaxID=5507 RepID=A0A420PS50_FUSOX|nr:hypothetical protein BFJ65_g7886 [Fusarium oxysporum f. sp. cepae]RKK95357.1 hypothetical protein BFJ68_g14804 [Fusarium oxysporum]RYC82918.1 hypothetical protein BFJ63_vAg14168 [Fusarium oxysporum f. sp. narcissi]RKK34642.1 hypothetical protein BFJ67_g13690 [Fusarium oxysporum f. sp. cepae]RKK58939.1 hypothetical protein BFJ66_g2574 [Fusarium oxysporum f. sp. cepae]